MLRLKSQTIQTTANRWERLPDGGYRCGNVEIHLADELSPKAAAGTVRWFVYERTRGDLKLVMPATRPYGYGNPGQAKIGAALMVRHRQRREKQQPRATPCQNSMGPS